MKILLIQMLLLASVVACEKDNQIDPNTVAVKILPSQFCVRVNDTIPLSVYVQNDENFQLDYEWNASSGHLEVSGTSGLYVAPQRKEDVVISVKIKDQFGNLYQDSVVVKVYKQFVILKADDLVYDSQHVFPQRWNRFVEHVDNRNIKASIGIIGSSLSYGNSDYFDRIKEYHYKGVIEFWNHGYDHLLNGVNAAGEKYHEFQNSPLIYQKAQISKTQSLAKNKLGFTLRAFGAPGNAIDSITLKAIEADSTIKIWFYGNPSFSRLNLKRHASIEIEYPVHNPDFNKFKLNYESQDPLLVLQLHPNSWDSMRFQEYASVIDFLINQDVTFINPYEYYKLINNVIEDIMF